MTATAQVGTTPDRFDRARMLERNLDRQLDAIRASDAKITLLVPTTTAMIGIMAALLRLSNGDGLPLAHAALSTLPLVAAYALMAFAIVPRFRTGQSPSLLFFGGLAARGPGAARDALLAMDADGYLADLAEQCHATATIARTKYRHVRNAYVAFFVALPFWTYAIYALTRPF